MLTQLICRSLALLSMLWLLTGCVALRTTLQILSITGTRQDVVVDLPEHEEQARTAANPSPPSIGQSTGADHPLLDLLRYIPDTPAHRRMLTYGDIAAWHAAWAVPRVDSFDAVQALPSPQREQWLLAMPRQTLPPEVLGVQYLAVEEMDDLYGFSLFDTERYLDTGEPPSNFAVIDVSVAKTQVVTALTGFGYACTSDSAGYLCSIGKDNQQDLQSPSLVGRLGGLNRIAVLDGRLIVGRATGLITNAQATYAGDHRSLADDPFYQAAVTALDSPALAANGALVGVLFFGTPLFDDPMVMLDQDNTAIQEQLASYAEDPLPPIALAAFATYRAADASYLTVALVFPIGVDAQASAAALARRMQVYISPVTQQSLEEQWTFQRADAFEAAGLPVALVTMRVEDPGVSAEENWHIFNWADLVFRRDLLFLTNGLPSPERE